MWRHQIGRIDFDEPLLRLLRRGWRFRELGPIVGARDDGCWAVTAFHGWVRVRAGRLERKDAWAEAVRFALRTVTKRKRFLEPSLSDTVPSSPDDPSVCDEERTRLKAIGWSFSEHIAALANGGDGWVVSGTRSGQRVRAEENDRCEAWGTALILAAVTGTNASALPSASPVSDSLG
jgi:hypothetical protein